MRRLTADAWTLRELCDGWELAGTAPGARQRAERLDELEWLPAAVPGTVSSTLTQHNPHDPRLVDLDAWDWWFRCKISTPAAGGEDELLLLWLDGLATIAEIYLDDALILASESMFLPQATSLSTGEGPRELAICLRALRPLLEVRRKPRARWRTQLVRDANLRFFRTMLIGRAPGLAAGSPVVGPYRSVLLQRLRQVAVSDLRLRAELVGGEGRVSVDCRVQTLPSSVGVDAVTLTVTGPNVQAEAELSLWADEDGLRAAGGLVIAEPQLWWPHTHGSPVLYETGVRVRRHDGQEVSVNTGRVGLRDLRVNRDLERDGLSLSCNDVALFIRGAVWSPPCPDGAQASEARLRAALEHVVDAGMNMLRVPGVSYYETPRFYELCDELGILVWQDFLFANFDYPELSAQFMQTVRDETHAILDELGHRPSLAILCGGSEVAQQVAMLGLDPELANGPLYADLLPDVVREANIQALYIPSTPWGGELPFRTDRGVANYYGVGAYRRPLDDARRSDVRFAAECLAFSNVPDDDALEAVDGGLGIGDPDWKLGVPRDAGTGWDFEDVRDHYLRLIYGVDAVAMRSFDQARYLELSRHVSGDVMAKVFGEWRREASACAGGLVLWLTDLRPGAGWGLLDDRGQPKVAMHYLRRALAPVAVWGTDEGLGGLQVHVANDRPHPLVATLRVALYRDGEIPVGEAVQEISLPGHTSHSVGVEAILGRFVDISWAYRFGPPAQDLVVMSLEQHREAGAELLSQSFFHPCGRSVDRAGASALGLEATLHGEDEEFPYLRVRARRFADGVRVDAPGFRPVDDAFSVEPGHERDIRLRREGRPDGRRGSVTALNLSGSVPIGGETWS